MHYEKGQFFISSNGSLCLKVNNYFIDVAGVYYSPIMEFLDCDNSNGLVFKLEL